VILDMMQQAPDWERFRHGARRHLGDAAEESETFEELVRSVPDLVNETVQYLRPKLVDDSFSEAGERSVVAVREYLACA
jgi:hypothetical protein